VALSGFSNFRLLSISFKSIPVRSATFYMAWGALFLHSLQIKVHYAGGFFFVLGG
jgi:hypothetical protein